MALPSLFFCFFLQKGSCLLEARSVLGAFFPLSHSSFLSPYLDMEMTKILLTGPLNCIPAQIKSILTYCMLGKKFGSILKYSYFFQKICFDISCK